VKLNPGLSWEKQDSTRRILFISKLDINLRKKLGNSYAWKIALYGAETWTLQKRDQKYLGSFEMRCWRRMAKISWTDSVKNVDVLRRVKEEWNIVQTVT